MSEAKTMPIHYSKHALARIRQRGIRESDIPVIVAAGTQMGDDSVFLLDQDVEREIQKRKLEIAVLERLRGCRVVIAGETVVTVYRPSRKTEKLVLRGEQGRNACCGPATQFHSSLHRGGHEHAA
jgi:S-adenosylmethionine:tRNA-ribosyltransferase-isomerase (queuine synthetase)